jgi:hypothetical protein
VRGNDTILPTDAHRDSLWSFECFQQKDTFHLVALVAMEYDVSTGKELTRSSEYEADVFELHVANYMNILL